MIKIGFLSNKRLRERVFKYTDLSLDDHLSKSERERMLDHAIDLTKGKFTIEDKIDHYQDITLNPEGKTKNQVIYAQKRLNALLKIKKKNK